jgi:hypothetical protein
MTASHSRVRQSRDQVCRKSIEPARRLAGFANAGATMPGGLRAGLERSWIGEAVFAQASNAPTPCPSPGAGADSLIGFLVAEHTGISIVEIDLTRIGPVSRFPFVRNAARSGPLRVAALRTAQTMAAEKSDRSRTEFPLCIGLSASVAELGPSTSRLTIQNSASAFWLLRTWTPSNSRKRASEITQVHALTALELQTNVANALDAQWSD